jgi:hypothetical protein
VKHLLSQKPNNYQKLQAINGKKSQGDGKKAFDLDEGQSIFILLVLTFYNILQADEYVFLCNTARQCFT